MNEKSVVCGACFCICAIVCTAHFLKKYTYSLKALVAEKVREVERESRRRIKHFIRNKQVRDTPTCVYKMAKLHKKNLLTESMNSVHVLNYAVFCIPM